MTTDTRPDGYPSTARARFALATLVTLYFLIALDGGLVGLLLEPMKKEMALSDIQVGFAHATTLSLAYGLSSIPMGMLADRLNRVRLLIGAILLWTGAMLLAGLTPSLFWLIVSRIGLGAASATVYPAAMSLIADIFPPERRASATGAFAAGRVVGQSSAFLLGGALFGAFASLAATANGMLFGLSPWRALFVLFAIIGLLLLPLVAALREPVRQEVARPGGGTLRDLAQHRTFLIPLLLGMAFLTFSVATANTWTAPLLMRIHGLQPSEFGPWFGPIALAAGLTGVAAGARFCNLARARGGQQAMLVPAVAGSILAALASLFAVMPDLVGFALLYGLFIVATGAVIVVAVIAINVRMPNELRGLALALEVVAIAVAGAIAPGLVALVGRELGGDLMLGQAMALVSFPSSLIAAFCYFLAIRFDRTRPAKPAPFLDLDTRTDHD